MGAWLPCATVLAAYGTPCAAKAPLLLRVGGDVVGDFLRAALLRALLILGLIRHLELGEVEGDVLGEPVFAAAAAGRHSGDEHFVHRDDEVLQRRATGLAHRENSLVEVLACAARIDER